METFAIILTILSVTLGTPSRGRIFGGTPATPDQFPFIASINDPEQLCDGVIINISWLLTAANCLIEASSDTRVLVGTTFQHSGGYTYSVQTMIIHQDFNNQTLKNNIGLLQINGEFTFNAFVQPIHFGDSEGQVTCATAGWGMTEDVEIPEELQYIVVTTLSLDSCKLFDDRIDEEEVCAIADVGQGFCYGDAGGPLVCEGLLVGLVSFAIFPCGEGIPDVYTKVTAYENWINETIAK